MASSTALQGTQWTEVRVDVPTQGERGGCASITSQPGLAQAGSIPPLGTTIRTWVSFSCSSAQGSKDPKPSVVNGGCTPSVGRCDHPCKAQPKGTGLSFPAGMQQGQQSTEMGSHTLETAEPPRSACAWQHGGGRSK